MNVKYTIKEVKPNIFAVIIKDHYDRAMTFCRAQEFYESPNKKFRGKDFNIWDYLEWYSRQNGDSFTYAKDWGGFNIPLLVAWECYEGKKHSKKVERYNGVRSLPDTWKSKWDETMKDIVWTVQSRMFNKENERNMNAYIIGADNMNSELFKHEVCHGLWATNKEYRQKASEVIKTISPYQHYKVFKNNLLEMGYTAGVVDDEIHAYLTTNWNYDKFGKGVGLKDRKKYHKEFNKQLYEFIN